MMRFSSSDAAVFVFKVLPCSEIDGNDIEESDSYQYMYVLMYHLVI